MNKKDFSKIRYHLEKTQKQMAQLLGSSIKTIQSFEQGWRKIPVHTERQLLLLAALKHSSTGSNRPCWVVKKCPKRTRQDCPAWEFSAGHMCWCINGTICRGEPQKSWRKKMEICNKCEVLQSILSICNRTPSS